MKKTKRSRLVSLIHMQKNKAALGDDEYRLILSAETGKESCSDCTLSELEQVFRAMNNLLVRMGESPFHIRNLLYSSLAEVVQAKARRVLGDGWASRLQGFLSKMGRKSLDDCSDIELRRILGFLSTLQRQEASRD